MILCKVVDNFGDIGVVYRLARALSSLRPTLNLTLVVSNLESFHKMAAQIDPKKPVQTFRYKNSTWMVLDWNLDKEKVIRNKENGEIFLLQDGTSSSLPSITSNLSPLICRNLLPITPSLSLIMECFQCGRPDWLEEILFAPDFCRTVQILQIDYLSAEDYAEEFHLLKSGTRKANIKKIFFMPGFTEKTGGLIINENGNLKTENSGVQVTPKTLGVTRFAGRALRGSVLPHSIAYGNGYAATPIPNAESKTSSKSSHFSIFFFAYEDDCAAVVRAISDFQAKIRERESDFSVIVYLADGKSSAPFEESWKKFNSPFKIEKIPFLQQEEFDEFLLKMDFLFVRGEDSLSRAALFGLPFVWQAYKQDENYQLVKVNALLEQMKPYFSEEEFKAVQDFWQSYNDYENTTKPEPLAQMLISAKNQKNTDGFKKFAKKLHENGNLAEHLLAFIDSLPLFSEERNSGTGLTGA